jgi:thymidylate synthase ThyX
MYSAKIIADSLAPCLKRLTTMEVTFSRIVLAEFNTHRQFSRNSASSRAIPVEKMLKRVKENPFIPERFPVNIKGMQASDFYEPGSAEYAECKQQWLSARDESVFNAEVFVDLNVHKQIANRLLEPFLWHTVIVSATERSNFFAQRCHPDAQPEIRTIAEMMRHLYHTNEPRRCAQLQWHTPFIQDDEMDLPSEQRIRLSVARCARVSYLTHDGKRDHEADFALYERLCAGMHWSPFEHVASASKLAVPSGNFVGWFQYRKEFADECR